MSVGGGKIGSRLKSETNLGPPQLAGPKNV